MKRSLTAGILAHVDAGKTTLSEALLYTTGAVRSLGRVDHGSSVLDNEALERERGITIFTKEAVLETASLRLSLLDTPGHTDFTAELERSLQVLDFAILVLSGTDGVQSHTETIWKLLARYQVPAFVFVNKMDLPGKGREALLAELAVRLGPGFADASAPGSAAFYEAAALADDCLLEAVLAGETPSDEALSRAVMRRRLYPVCFGSALRAEGVDTLLSLLDRLAPPIAWPAAFGARVFKISRDSAGKRLTWLKVTGGELRVKDSLHTEGRAGGQGEKVSELRVYEGGRARAVPAVPAGAVAAIPGLVHSFAGQGFGAEPRAAAPAMEPVFSQKVLLPQGADVHTALAALHRLADEDPLLRPAWDERLGEVRIETMGTVQLEVLARRLEELTGLSVSFGPAGILYRETVSGRWEGVGHFEPLRHYAEVHVLVEGTAPGSGIQLESACSEDMLARSWQRLALSALAGGDLPGVLMGAPLTDVRVTLLTGRAHPKHTEGGDFAEAARRALRQALRKGRSVLLEPRLHFTLTLPEGAVGRAIADLERLHASFAPPAQAEGFATLEGEGPAATLADYARKVNAYTSGQGRFSAAPDGYAPCHDASSVLAEAGYDPDADLAHPSSSVFCSHGASVLVPWDEVDAMAHLPLLPRPKEEPDPARAPARGHPPVDPAVLEAIFAREFAPLKAGRALPAASRRAAEQNRAVFAAAEAAPPAYDPPDYLLVDGYNILFSWDGLRRLAEENLDLARTQLQELLCNYRGVTNEELILVFDAYRVKGNPGSAVRYHNIHLVFTREAETADAYIEKVTYELGRRHRVRVATSDSAEQMIVLGAGALRVSSRAFRQEVDSALGEIQSLLATQAARPAGVR